jgi:threonine dehydratase
MQQIQEAASAYGISVNPGAPPGSYQGEMGDATQLNLGQTSPLDLSRLDIGTPLNYVIPSTVPMSESIPFPPYDDLDIVHGQGTVALELEQEVSTGDQFTSSHQQRQESKSRPDIVLGDFDSGVTLSGICMAFVGTGTHVFGAAPTTGFWDHVWNLNTPSNPAGEGTASYQDAQGNQYWADIKHPISATLWSTFTAPGHLSGVFEVDSEQVQAASILARDNYQLQLEPDESVPLAVALYNEDFQRFVNRESKRGRKLVVGIVLRSRRATH